MRGTGYTRFSAALGLVLPGALAGKIPVHIRHRLAPAKGALLLNKEALGVVDGVNSGQFTHREKKGVGRQRLVHAGAFQVVARFLGVGAHVKGKHLVPQVLLQIVEPGDLATVGAVLQDAVAKHAAHKGLVLARRHHGNAVGLLTQGEVVMVREPPIFDPLLAVGVLKHAQSGKVPAGSTVLLVVSRNVVGKGELGRDALGNRLGVEGAREGLGGRTRWEEEHNINEAGN
mmetsp:Transcript_20120/g.51026  ORF Transcript_20120/g.51026 Transcript_20120/m.51026 type:complete len:230 (+) Transcript_20120:1054-1743(+)